MASVPVNPLTPDLWAEAIAKNFRQKMLMDRQLYFVGPTFRDEYPRILLNPDEIQWGLWS